MLIVILCQFSGAAQKVNYQSISHDNIKSTRVEQNTVCDLIIHSVPKKNCLTSPWTYYVVFIEPPLRYLLFRVFDYFLQNDDIKTSNSLRRKWVEIGSWLAVLSATVGGGFMVMGSWHGTRKQLCHQMQTTLCSCGSCCQYWNLSVDLLFLIAEIQMNISAETIYSKIQIWA